VVAIDGPAGAGKSSTAMAVARALSFHYVDSGAFYRAAALVALRRSLARKGALRGEELARILRDVRIEQRPGPEGNRTLLDGEDVTEALRSPAVTTVVSRVAADPAVRRALTEKLRESASAGPVVMDGRDIGTVVFPAARLKVFLEASLEERARRRSGADRRRVAPAALARRDELDRGRATAPLFAAPDAVLLVTDDMTLEQQVQRIVGLYRERASEPASD
jgi:cytidylate kinase